ncbi:MAG TPA: hypothetical protein PLA98_02635 [Alicycliphilus sp.]|jgi:hypothetical protein|nr:hypothetical protein [Acidovorax temperans]HRN63716.1 hypothetical protein [Alicycliphilus sp.]
MNSEQFFTALIHRLQRYDDAMVLHAVIQQQADVTELRTTATRIALDLLGHRVEKKQVQRALDRLSDLGLLQVRPHPNYRTLITVDREAVQALLRTPVSDYLPGLSSDSFPFLDDLNGKVQTQTQTPVVQMTGWPTPPFLTRHKATRP